MSDDEWPSWWTWELDLSPHPLKRMIDRGFTEVDLREMVEHATQFAPDREPGRWLIHGRLRGESWRIIVEPDAQNRVVVVITAYHI